MLDSRTPATATGKSSSLWASRLLSVGLTVLVSFGASPARASNDPFRTGDNAREMTPEIAIAMNTYFCDGNFDLLSEQMEAARLSAPQEPMIYVSMAALAYLDEDYDTIGLMIDETLTAVESLKETDPLRAHIYAGAGYGMRAAHRIVTDGLASGLPRALPDINAMFAEFRGARRIDANDPELNYMSGFIDLMMTRRQRALEQFDSIEYPSHMAYRAQAMALRDMDNYSDALERVDLAISTGCDNPELYYLKAQILRLLDRPQASIRWFERALAMSDQLPETIVEQIQYERDRTELKMNEALQREQQASREVADPTASN